MSIGQKGSHSRGPILGDNKAGDGLFEDIPLAYVDQVRSPYRVWVDRFGDTIVDETAFNLLGGTATASAGVAANSIVGSAAGRLLINAGTAANTGYASVQFNAAANSAVNNRYNALAIATSSTAFGNGKEVIWFARVGFSAAAAGAWDGGALLGWFITDTSLLDLITLLPTVAAGGGIGFHIGSTGAVTYVSNDAAITTAGAVQVGTIAALTSTVVFYEFGFRFKTTDYTTQTGMADFYFGTQGNMAKVASTFQNGTLPVPNATTYSSSFALINGAAAATDMHLESLLMGLSRFGQTGTV